MAASTNKNVRPSISRAGVFAAWAASLTAATVTVAAPVYSNDFETGLNGMTIGGVLVTATRASLPVDGGGLSSPNQSMWMGRLGNGIAKAPSSKEIVSLSLTGLQPGATYTVAFDLLVGASWDGAAQGYGNDLWYFAANGTRLIDTSFSNGDQGRDYGAYSPQRYTDSSFTTPISADVPAFSGAEFSRREGPGYSGYYGIYYFGRGAGNPAPSFVATGATATLEWTRYSGTQNFGDSSDEYWALDNVVVDGVPGSACTGDLNSDGFVDDADFQIFVVQYDIVVCGDPGMAPGCPADLNADGFVDDADFVLFAAAYNQLIYE